MSILLAIIGALGIILLAIFLLMYGYGIYWSLRHWPATIALRKERVQEMVEQDTGFQNLFFVFKCVAWLFIWPFPLYHWIRRAVTRHSTLRRLKRQNPGATVTCTKQGNKVTYVIETVRVIDNEEDLTAYLLGHGQLIEDGEEHVQ